MKEASKSEMGKAEGHGDTTQPAGLDSPATFTPLAAEPSSANQKGEIGRKGYQGSQGGNSKGV